MQLSGAIVTYVLLWWLVLFMTLPMRPKSVWEEPDEHAKGSDRGAPVDPALWFKIKLTTGITIPLWLSVVAVISSGLLDSA